ncbi:hypothetical protein VUR80DRAFT_178 [Thermomyces stellatus]
MHVNLLWLGLCLAKLGAAVAPDNGRERIRLHTGWKFWRSETIPDKIVYDMRPDVEGDDLTVLKDWILPCANDFIRDPEERYERPSDEPDIAVEYVAKSFDDSEWDEVRVPHDWAIKLPFLEGDHPITPRSMGQLPVHGVGWYRRTLEVSSEDLENTVYLEIDGAMSYPMVWVNEKLVGGWPYGYNSFRLDITRYLEEGDGNQLAVRVENPRGSSSRWYPGAGLYRNVWLTKVKPVHVAHWGTYIRSRSVSSDSAVVDVEVHVQNTADKEREVTLSTEIYDVDANTGERGEKVASVEPEKVQLDAKSKEAVNSSVTISNPRLWGPLPQQTPNLYIAVTRVEDEDELLDTYETQFGIRTLRFDANEGVFVNGESVFIQGANQHHDLGALGAAFNVRAAERQLELLQELGVNAIRMAHNPPAPELLDLTDRMGFLVLDEIFDTWSQEKVELDYHLIFDDWREPDLRAFIRRDRNHPSVMAWSYGNEVAEQKGDDDKAAEISTFLRGIAGEEDPTRRTTASMHYSSPNMSLPETMDIVSLNYQGEGMRYGPAYGHLKDGLHKTPQYDGFHDEFPDKPIWGSEVAWSLSSRGSFLFPVTNYTSAPLNDTSGGDPSNWAISAYELYTSESGSSADRVFWTQDEHPFVSGGFVWSGWDYLGEPWWCDDCRSAHAGVIDTAGFKKERFWLYQARWRPDFKMAHILPHWNWAGREGEVTPVHVFSAADEAELFLNGESQGLIKRGPREYRFRWDDVRYEAGELHVVTYKDGEEWATDTVRTTGEASGLNLTADRVKINSDGEDLSFLTLEVVDDDGNMVPKSNYTVSFSVSGPGELLATDNGYPADYRPFTSDTRETLNGLLLAVVAAQPGETGVITVTAESEDFGSAEIELESY